MSGRSVDYFLGIVDAYGLVDSEVPEKYLRVLTKPGTQQNDRRLLIEHLPQSGQTVILSSEGPVNDPALGLAIFPESPSGIGTVAGVTIPHLDRLDGYYRDCVEAAVTIAMTRARDQRHNPPSA
jgi:hypothetical protein